MFPMSATPDTGPRKRKTPCANTGRLSLFDLRAIYILLETLQFPFKICFWQLEQWRDRVDVEIMRRKEGLK